MLQRDRARVLSTPSGPSPGAPHPQPQQFKLDRRPGRLILPLSGTVIGAAARLNEIAHPSSMRLRFIPDPAA